MYWIYTHDYSVLMRSDNKFCKLATMSLLWQQWTETLVGFDDWTNSQPSLQFGSTEKVA
jgi:hypothetical protein